jgi:hypothetical protein
MDRTKGLIAVGLIGIVLIGLAFTGGFIGSFGDGGLGDSDLTVKVNDLMIHEQESGDNDVIANVSVAVDGEAKEGAAFSYVSCTDCTMPRTMEVVDPGQEKHVLYEYNLENQSAPVFDNYSINYVGTSNIPQEDLESGSITAPWSYTGGEVNRIWLELPDQEQIQNRSVGSYSEELSTGN